MPRERIIDGPLWAHYPKGYTEPGDGPNPSARIYRPGDEVPEGAAIYQDPSADLVWQREDRPGAGTGWVQLTAEVPREWAQSRIAEATEGRYVQIPFEVLDRRALNNLIRLLKRARDAAYGADE